MEDSVVRSVVGAVRLSNSSSNSSGAAGSISGNSTAASAAAAARGSSASSHTVVPATIAAAAVGGSVVLTRLSLTAAAYMLRHPRAAEAFLEAGLVEEITALLQRLTAIKPSASRAISVDSVSEEDESEAATAPTAAATASSAEDRVSKTVLLRLCSRIAYLL
jgi:hypothetical protein